MTTLARLLSSRYGSASPDGLAPTSALPPAARGILEHMLAHRSVRAFTDQPLPEGTVQAMVAAAQSAATSSNLQTWSVIAVQDPARKAKLSEWSNNQAHIRRAPLFLVWLADLSRLDRVASQRAEHADAHRYLEMFLTAALDVALAAQNAVLAAEALGLGTVYIGALRNRPEDVVAELKLPPLVFPVFGMCVGHPDPAQPAGIKPRLAQPVVLHQEAYGADNEAGAISGYDVELRAFQRAQAMPEVDWSAQSVQRVAGAQSLSGRHRLGEAIRAQGFGLE